jgi:hypothetical protein
LTCVPTFNSLRQYLPCEAAWAPTLIRSNDEAIEATTSRRMMISYFSIRKIQRAMTAIVPQRAIGKAY